MNSRLLSSSPCLSLLCFLLVILLKIHSSSSNPCPPFECGNITADYPFWGESLWEACGPLEFKLDCNTSDLTTTMMINDVKYRVLDINSKVQTLRIAISKSQYFHNVCPESSITTFDSQFFNYFGAYENVTLNYGCPRPSDNERVTNCLVNGVKYENRFIQADDVKYSRECNASVSVPVPKPSLSAAKKTWSDWIEVLEQGFELKWKIGGMPCDDCSKFKGICGFDHTSNEKICYCPNITNQPPLQGPCPSNPPSHAPQAPPNQPPRARPGTHFHR